MNISDSDNDFVVNFKFNANLKELDEITNKIKKSLREITNTVNALNKSVYKERAPYRRSSERSKDIIAIQRNIPEIISRNRSIVNRNNLRYGQYENNVGAGGFNIERALRNLSLFTAGLSAATYALYKLTEIADMFSESIRSTSTLAKQTDTQIKDVFGLQMAMMRKGFREQEANQVLSFVRKMKLSIEQGLPIPQGYTALRAIGLGPESFMGLTEREGTELLLRTILEQVPDLASRMSMLEKLGMDPRIGELLTPDAIEAISRYESRSDIQQAVDNAKEFNDALQNLKASFLELAVTISPVINLISSLLDTISKLFMSINFVVTKLNSILSFFPKLDAPKQNMFDSLSSKDESIGLYNFLSNPMIHRLPPEEYLSDYEKNINITNNITVPPMNEDTAEQLSYEINNSIQQTISR